MSKIRRIVTLTTTAVTVGPNVVQWAYSLQPYAARGIHVQVRRHRDDMTVEAVEIDGGVLIARGHNIVSLRREMEIADMREVHRPHAERILAAVRAKGDAMREVAGQRGVPHLDLPLAA